MGLDGSAPHRASLPAQRTVFTRMIREAERLGGRVLSIHSRRAAKEVVECLTANSSAERVLPILSVLASKATLRSQATSWCTTSRT
ncbi:MAG: hypothetical protein EHM13_15010, partial [Acidobacteria bacterium]